MILLLLLAFAGSLAGIFLLLGMTPFAFAEDITRPFARKKKPIARRIEETVNPREPKGIQKTVREARAVMTLTGKGGKFTALCGVSFFLLVVGIIICIVADNYFMLPVLSVGMALLPFWYVLFTSHSYKKLMNNEIETGLSIITSSYLRSESIITAVEENVRYLTPPGGGCVPGLPGGNQRHQRRCPAGPCQHETQAEQLRFSRMGGRRHFLPG